MLPGSEGHLEQTGDRRESSAKVVFHSLAVPDAKICRSEYNTLTGSILSTPIPFRRFLLWLCWMSLTYIFDSFSLAPVLLCSQWLNLVTSLFLCPLAMGQFLHKKEEVNYTVQFHFCQIMAALGFMSDLHRKRFSLICNTDRQ